MGEVAAWEVSVQMRRVGRRTARSRRITEGLCVFPVRSVTQGLGVDLVEVLEIYLERWMVPR